MFCHKTKRKPFIEEIGESQYTKIHLKEVGVYVPTSSLV